MNFEPQFFTRKIGAVEWAKPDWPGALRSSIGSKGRSAAQAAGIRYERKVFARLDRTFPGRFISHLPFRFKSDLCGWKEKAIPDGLIISKAPGEAPRVTVVEVKLRHCVDAWHQLLKVYLPIVQVAFPACRIKVLEVCKWYDPSVRLPGDFELVRDLEGFERRGISRYGVWVFDR